MTAVCPFTIRSPPESNFRDVNGFSAKHMTNPSSFCENNAHVLLLCQFKELIVGNLSKDMQIVRRQDV